MKKLNRIHILGTSGSGKTFLSKKLSKIFKIKIYDLDDIFWLRNGARKYDTKRNEKERNRLLNQITKRKKWIIEGCYSSWVEESIKNSDLVIWLNPPFHILAFRLISRFFKRKLLGTREGWRDLGLLLKYAKNYHKKGQPAGYYLHKELIEKHKVKMIYIQTSKELNRFLKEIK
jgi:adenylate kinase family enzyme